MYVLIVRLVLAVAFLQLGMNALDFRFFQDTKNTKFLDDKIRKVSRIDWRPISVFPEEGRRF